MIGVQRNDTIALLFRKELHNRRSV